MWSRLHPLLQPLPFPQQPAWLRPFVSATRRVSLHQPGQSAPAASVTAEEAGEPHHLGSERLGRHTARPLSPASGERDVLLDSAAQHAAPARASQDMDSREGIYSKLGGLYAESLRRLAIKCEEHFTSGQRNTLRFDESQLVALQTHLQQTLLSVRRRRVLLSLLRIRHSQHIRRQGQRIYIIYVALEHKSSHK